MRPFADSLSLRCLETKRWRVPTLFYLQRVRWHSRITKVTHSVSHSVALAGHLLPCAIPEHFHLHRGNVNSNPTLTL